MRPLSAEPRPPEARKDRAPDAGEKHADPSLHAALRNANPHRLIPTYRLDLVRWIDLEGAVNVRDLGGLPTTDGGTTRHGRILRSDNLQGLTPSDVDLLVGSHKVRHVVDLRSGPEVSLEGRGRSPRCPR
ncbi:tyrosine-protein phosphatase [Nonomuraea recticatena]|uniref:tyrosine-protein phosphatase n=1 Tax=Nonomuraea recticatena TaxID=46178 RepID=UPI0036127B4C